MNKQIIGILGKCWIPLIKCLLVVGYFRLDAKVQGLKLKAETTWEVF
jgi:hypothetical protein